MMKIVSCMVKLLIKWDSMAVPLVYLNHYLNINTCYLKNPSYSDLKILLHINIYVTYVTIFFHNVAQNEYS